jgi:HSP20 family protein
MAQNPVEVKPSTPSREGWLAPWTEMDRLFDRWGIGAPAFRRLFDTESAIRTKAIVPSPAIDIVEDEKAYRLTAELPGLEEKDVDISVSGDMLTLKGEKSQDAEHKDKNYTLSERSYGSFQRSFWLPDGVDRDKIEAVFAKGVLTITLPKAPGTAGPKKITVKPAG